VVVKVKFNHVSARLFSKKDIDQIALIDVFVGE